MKSLEIDWNQGYGAIWSDNCGFNFDSIGQEQISRDDCVAHCIDTPDCTQFTYFDGWCYKKSGAVEKSNAFIKPGVFCGIINIDRSNISLGDVVGYYNLKLNII